MGNVVRLFPEGVDVASDAPGPVTFEALVAARRRAEHAAQLAKRARLEFLEALEEFHKLCELADETWARR